MDSKIANEVRAVLSDYLGRIANQNSTFPDQEVMRRLAEARIEIELPGAFQRNCWPVPEPESEEETMRPTPAAFPQTFSTTPLALFENYTWRELSTEELTKLARQLDPVDGKYPFDADSVTGHISSLPWYGQVQLMRFTNPFWIPTHLTVYYLIDEGYLFRLNGTSPPIHEVNAKAPIQLNAQNILDYLRFFCFFVRGDEGPFYILESTEDPIVDVEMDQTTRSVFDGTVRPMTLEGVDKDGRFLCDCLIWYSNAMFIAKFSVEPTGMVHMLDDEPIAGDLSVKVDRPIA